MKEYLAKIARWVLESEWLLGPLSGYKRAIGKALDAAATIIAGLVLLALAVQEICGLLAIQFPELAAFAICATSCGTITVALTAASAFIAKLIAIAIKFLGDWHAQDKAAREVHFVYPEGFKSYKPAPESADSDKA